MTEAEFVEIFAAVISVVIFTLAICYPIFQLVRDTQMYLRFGICEKTHSRARHNVFYSKEHKMLQCHLCETGFVNIGT